jgi:6-phosphogluconolactonase (cycloisomerase 2 family)
MSQSSLCLFVGLTALLAMMVGCGSGSNNTTTPPPNRAEFLYVTSTNFSGGTVTSQLSSFKLDTSTGALSATFSGTNFGFNPYVAADPAAKFLYVSDISPQANFIDAFSIAPVTGAPVQSGVFSPDSICGPFCNSHPSAPGALALAPGGKTLYYGSSTIVLGGGVVQGVGALRVNGADGSLSVVPGSPFAADLIPIQVLIHPTGKFVYTANIGTASVGLGPGPVQSISCYSSDPSTGALAPVPGSPFPVTAPTSNFDFRGLMIHPSGRLLYLGTGFPAPGSGGNGVLGWSIDPVSGFLTPLTGSPFAQGTTIPVGVFDPSGKFLYSGNAGSAIVGFSVDQSSGALTPLNGLPVLAGTILGVPVIDPAGAFLFASEAKSKTLVGFRLNAQTGALTALGNPTPISGIPGWLTMVAAP